jgi:hypothetical protein
MTVAYRFRELKNMSSGWHAHHEATAFVTECPYFIHALCRSTEFCWPLTDISKAILCAIRIYVHEGPQKNESEKSSGTKDGQELIPINVRLRIKNGS